MSNDLFLQQQAGEAIGRADRAQHAATLAQQQAFDAAQAAQAARTAADEAAERAQYLGHQLDDMQEQNYLLHQKLEESELKRQAMTGIPFLRQEIATKYRLSQIARDTASSWLRGGPLVLPADLSGADANQATWLALALRYSVAERDGDTAAQQQMTSELMHVAPIKGAAWMALSDIANAGRPSLDHFRLLTDSLPKPVSLPGAIVVLLCIAAQGDYGIEIQERVKTFAMTWCAAMREKDEGKQLATLLLEQHAAPVKPIDFGVPMNKVGDYTASRFHQAVIQSWTSLHALATPVTKRFNSLSDRDPRQLMHELSQLVQSEEAEMRARLAFFERLLADGAKVAECEQQRQKEVLALKGSWNTTPPTTVCWLSAYGMSSAIIAAMLPQMSVAIDKFKSGPALEPARLFDDLQPEDDPVDHMRRRWKHQRFRSMDSAENAELSARWRQAKQTEMKKVARKRFWQSLPVVALAVFALFVYDSGRFIPHPLGSLFFPATFIGAFIEIAACTALVSWWLGRRSAKKNVKWMINDDGWQYCSVPDAQENEWRLVVDARARIMRMLDELPGLASAAKARFATHP